jgi:hypothetical protein
MKILVNNHRILFVNLLFGLLFLFSPLFIHARPSEVASSAYVYPKTPWYGQAPLSFNASLKGDNLIPNDSSIVWVITLNGVVKQIFYAGKSINLNLNEQGNYVLTAHFRRRVSQPFSLIVKPHDSTTYKSQKIVDFANFYYWDVTERGKCPQTSLDYRAIRERIGAFCSLKNKIGVIGTHLNRDNRDNASCLRCKNPEGTWYDKVKVKGFSNCVGLVNTILIQSKTDLSLDKVRQNPFYLKFWKDGNGKIDPVFRLEKIKLSDMRAWESFWEYFYKKRRTVYEVERIPTIMIQNPDGTSKIVEDESKLKPGDMLFSVDYRGGTQGNLGLYSKLATGARPAHNSHAVIFVGKEHPFCPGEFTSEENVIIEASMGRSGPVCKRSTPVLHLMDYYVRVR